MQSTHPDQRIYNLILTNRTFGNFTHTYALLGFENGQTWNLLGGKADPNETYEQAAARELYEESGMYYKMDPSYWNNLPYYEHTKHRVYIHAPTSQVGSTCIIEKLNSATTKCINDRSLSHDFKEMHRYQLIKLSDLIKLSNAQYIDDKTSLYRHPTEKEHMRIDTWLLFTLKHADKTELLKYL